MIPIGAAYLLRRLLVGHDLSGELAALPEPWKGMTEHLAGLPPEARAAAFHAMLAARAERDELVKALEGIDPTAPPPASQRAPIRDRGRCAPHPGSDPMDLGGVDSRWPHHRRCRVRGDWENPVPLGPGPPDLLRGAMARWPARDPAPWNADALALRRWSSRRAGGDVARVRLARRCRCVSSPARRAV